MRSKTAISILLTIAIVGYVIGLIGDPFTFVMFFIVALLLLSFIIISFIVNIIYKFLPQNIREIYEKHKIRVMAVIFGCFIFFYYGGWAINYYYLPHKFHPISLLADVGILLFTIFLGWNLIKPNKKRILFTTIIAIALFVFVLAAHEYYITPEICPSEALKSLPYFGYVVEDKAIGRGGGSYI